MKKNGILHAELSRIVASLGHGDLLIIGDAGLPVPAGVTCVDLAVTHGVPRFADVLTAVLSEMQVETAFIASEASTEVQSWMTPLTPTLIAHDAFKTRSADAVAIVRTGETTPFANVGLVAGVTF